MKKIVRLMESDLTNIIKRVIKENKGEGNLGIREKLNQVFFGYDPTNMFSQEGDFGYLSQEHRLSKKISPRQRVKRINQVIEELENYIQDLKNVSYGEEAYTQNPEYDKFWKDIEKDEELFEFKSDPEDDFDEEDDDNYTERDNLDYSDSIFYDEDDEENYV